MCVLIGVAGAAFDFYASILLHIVVCTDRQSIFYAFLSALYYDSDNCLIISVWCLNIQKKCTASLSLHSFSFVSFRFLVFGRLRLLQLLCSA